MPFQRALDEHFPGAVEEGAFMAHTLEVLAPHGFTADNSIACVGVCRDELCRTLETRATAIWGEAFNFSSLGGMLFLGKTGFGAAHAHAPVYDGKERYVYLSFTHIGIGPDGEQGHCRRAGRVHVSTACGALTALRDELHHGKITTRRNQDDIEQSLLKEFLLGRFEWGDKPDLIRLTKVAREVVFETLERMISLTVDTSTADYAVFSGVQIHRADELTFVWPARSYAVVDGKRVELSA